MEVTLHLICRIANNVEHKIVFNIYDEVLKMYNISNSDELIDLIHSKTEQWYEFNDFEEVK